MKSGRGLENGSPYDGALFWTGWYLVSLIIVLVAPASIRLDQRLWNLPAAEAVQSFAVGLGYLGLALYSRATRVTIRPASLLAVTIATVACFGLPWFLLTRWGFPASRQIFLIGAALSAALCLLPMVLRRYRAIGLAGGTAVVVGLALFEPPEPAPTDLIDRQANTAYYTIRIRSHPGLIPPGTGIRAGGAIARYRDGFILATGSGDFYRIRRAARAGDSLRSLRLPMKTPFNLREFLDDLDQRAKAPVFRITDLAVAEPGDTATMYVAHHFWSRERRCVALRVSRTAIRDSAGTTVALTDGWSTAFESQPCLTLGSSLPAVSMLESGGALAIHPEGLLISLGDMGIEGLDGEAAFSQDVESPYGKILLLHPDGTSKVMSVGHRNPQGLAVAPDGRTWEAEHGPQGGDELNLIVQDGNYGWPLATYGTQYGIDTWPLAPDSRDHGPFREPAYAFVPSPGISQLIQLGSEQFPRWAGDLLVGSLRGQTVYRVKNRGDRVIYVEPIAIGTRIRDLAQASDGLLVLWSDDGRILTLSRAPQQSNGRWVYETQCGGCHDPPRGAAESLGPTLQGVIGRSVASVKGYRYSEALQSLGGTWNKERLDQFLQDPAAYAPGTNMTVGALSEAGQRRAVIEYLSRHR